MWLLFFLAVALGACFLIWPGYLCFRAIGLSRFVSYACAPCMGILILVFWGAVLEKIGVSGPWWVVILPSVIPSLVIYLLFRARVSPKTVCDPSAFLFDLDKGRMAYGAFVVFAFFVLMFYFVRLFDGPASFSQAYDNLYHLNQIQSFVDSGTYSTMSTTVYLDRLHVSPTNTSSFYPAGWTVLAALIASALSVPAAFAENATNMVFLLFVYSPGSFLLVSYLLKSASWKKIAACCFVPYVVIGFPWAILNWGPLYPNVAGLCMLPVVSWLFVILLENDIALSMRVRIGVVFALCLLGCTLVHSSMPFSVGLFVAPYLVSRVSSFASERNPISKNKIVSRAIYSFASILAISAIWYLVYSAPISLIQGVVSYRWPSFESVSDSLLDVAIFRFNHVPMQPLLVILVVIGIARELLKEKRLWVFSPMLVALFAYVLCACSDGSLRAVLSGFWYQDPYRIAALASLYSVPVIASGVIYLLEGIGSFVPHKSGGLFASAVSTVMVVAMCFAAFSPRTFIADKGELSPFGWFEFAYGWHNIDSLPDQYYSGDEALFVKKAMEIIPEGSLVINVPFDGSAYTYSADCLNVFYRGFWPGGNGLSSETDESALIRESLYKIEQDEDVLRVVESIGAKYVLLLDQGEIDQTKGTVFPYDDSIWQGISSIEDGTPGFKLLMSEGDMRLYEITALD